MTGPMPPHGPPHDMLGRRKEAFAATQGAAAASGRRTRATAGAAAGRRTGRRDFRRMAAGAIWRAAMERGAH
jgi:hypothetical protein